MLSRNLYKVKKAPLGEKRKKAIISLVLMFSLFFIVYGVLEFQKMKPVSGQKEELKQETGDRPIRKNQEIYINSDEGLSLRKERNQNSERLIVIPNKTKLEASEELDGWYKVSYDGKEGWVAKQYTTTEAPAADPFKDWGVYTSTSGYKIKYPLGWKVKDYGVNTSNKASSVVAFSNQALVDTIPVGSDFIAPIIVKVSTDSLDKAKADFATISGVKTEAIAVAGMSGVKYTYTSTYSNTQQTAIVVGDGSKVFVFIEGGGYVDDLLNMSKTFTLGG